MNNSSTRESVNCLFLLTMVLSQGKFSPRHGPKGTKVLTCCGVVGADEPLQVGSSSRKSSRGLAEGSERGSGQRPEALRDFATFAIDFHHLLSCFQLRKMRMIGTFCTRLFQSKTRIN